MNHHGRMHDAVIADRAAEEAKMRERKTAAGRRPSDSRGVSFPPHGTLAVQEVLVEPIEGV